jgi:hypothetical protein
MGGFGQLFDDVLFIMSEVGSVVVCSLVVEEFSILVCAGFENDIWDFAGGDGKLPRRDC